jgi:hypothetical protein
MSKSLLVLSEGLKVLVSKDDSKKEFSVKKITESEGSTKVVLEADDSETITLVIAQKTGKEYYEELTDTLKKFGESAGEKIAELASDASSDLKRLGKTLDQLNLTKRMKGAFSGIGKKSKK